MEPNKKKALVRQSNFELLRIIAMIMIIASHLTSHGLLHSYANNMDSAEKVAVWANGTIFHRVYSAFLLPGGVVGVALFFMVTGYFLIDRTKPGKIHKLIYQGIFYAFVGLLILVIAHFLGFTYQYSSKTSIFYSLISTFVITYSSWWFFNTYVFLMFIFPAVTSYFNMLSKRGQIIILTIAWPLIYTANLYKENEYANLIKALFFFLLGGCIKHCVTDKISVPKKIILLAGAIVGWVGDGLAYYFLNYFTAIDDVSSKSALITKLLSLLDYGVFVPLCACSIFLLFSTISLQSKTVNVIAATTFGIYLMHDNSVVREILWRGLLKVDTVQYSSDFFVLYSILSVLGIFTVACLTDIVREKVYSPIAEKNWNAIVDFSKKTILKS